LTKTVGVKMKKLACQWCNNKYSLITAVDTEDWLFCLTKRQTRLYGSFKKLCQQGASVAELVKHAARTRTLALEWGKRNHKHKWIFCSLNGIDNLVLRCESCKAKKQAAANAINLARYALIPHLHGAKFTKKERKTIENLLLPNKAIILKGAKRDIKKKIKILEKAKRRLRKLDGMCNVLAL